MLQVAHSSNDCTKLLQNCDTVSLASLDWTFFPFLQFVQEHLISLQQSDFLALASWQHVTENFGCLSNFFALQSHKQTASLISKVLDFKFHVFCY